MVCWSTRSGKVSAAGSTRSPVWAPKLKSHAPGQPVRETPTATWDELVAFRAQAKRLGYGSIATAALLTWEWQRQEHVFGAFEVSHYRPNERPNSVKIVHPKNGEEAWWSLFDDNGEPLFPELMEELDSLKETIGPGLMFRRDHEHRKSITPLPWITERKDLRYLRGVVKKIVNASGIRKELSFTSFRHGGFTEGADSDYRCRIARCSSRSIGATATTNLCQTHTQTTYLRLQKTARGTKQGCPGQGYPGRFPNCSRRHRSQLIKRWSRRTTLRRSPA